MTAPLAVIALVIGVAEQRISELAKQGREPRCLRRRHVARQIRLGNPLLESADAAAVGAVDDLCKPWQRESVDSLVFALDRDPAATHLVRHSRRRAGATEAVENDVAGAGRDVEDAL